MTKTVCDICGKLADSTYWVPAFKDLNCEPNVKNFNPNIEFPKLTPIDLCPTCARELANYIGIMKSKDINVLLRKKIEGGYYNDTFGK